MNITAAQYNELVNAMLAEIEQLDGDGAIITEVPEHFTAHARQMVDTVLSIVGISVIDQV